MDRWKYFDITHRNHIVCNPVNIAKLQEMVDLFNLPDGVRVLDMACGKGTLLVHLVERYRCSAVGVDISPYFIREARERTAERAQNSSIDLYEMDGADYAAAPESFDLVTCLGASWIWQGYRGTMEALARWTKPGGQILVGEPFWQQEPEPDYLAAQEVLRETFGTHVQNVHTGIDLGLTPLYSMVSNGDDWDRYEGLQWRAAEIWAEANPHDPDRGVLLERCRASRDTYLRWGRNTLGWALYLFRK